MTNITIKAWLDSGANAYSTYETEFEIDEAEWSAMTEEAKNEYARECACAYMDWGWEIKKKKNT